MDENLTPERVAELHAAGEIELVDIREPHEREAGHVPGSRHIEFARLSQEAGSIDREKPLVLYCRMGGRSSAWRCRRSRPAASTCTTWRAGCWPGPDKGLPLEPEDGSVADH